MNVTSYSPAISIPTVANPATDALRRDNQQREMIAQPAAVQQSAAEKGVASDRDKARSPAQNNDQVDFENLRKQAELANSRIASDEEGGSPHDSQGNDQNQDEQNAEQDNRASADGTSDQDDKVSQEQKAERANEFAEQIIINDLKQRDKEVKAHEAAHASVGGSTTGAPSYTYEEGPDGKRYAVAGEVAVDLSPIAGDPQATITKLQKAYSAALAPAHPSIQDTRVASSAAKLILQAQSEILSLHLEDSKEVLQSGKNEIISERFSANEDENITPENDFDRHIKQTLAAQEQVAPSRSNEIDQRAVRVENFYSTINHAYEKPSSPQFELTA